MTDDKPTPSENKQNDELPKTLSMVARELADNLLEGRGLLRYGVRIVSDPLGNGKASSWEDTTVSIEGRDGTLEELPIDHDERGAPYVIGEGPGGEARLLVSLTDEDNLLGVAWAEPSAGSKEAGIGIDIASTAEFARTEAGDRFARLLLSDFEQSLASDIHPEDVAMGRAFLFAAKEAAFKAASAAVRSWYLSHDDEVFFEARDFQMAGDGSEVLAEKRADTYERLGIGHIEVSHVPFGRYVACCAVALKA